MKKDPTKKPVKKVVDDSPEWEEGWRTEDYLTDESEWSLPIHKSEKTKPPTPSIGKAEKRRKPVAPE